MASAEITLPHGMDWDLRIALPPPGDHAVYRRVAEAIIADIRVGRLRAGSPLPGSRRLADSLGVHRNTIVAAYRHLGVDGWIETRPGQGSYVSALPPNDASGHRRGVRQAVPSRVHFSLPQSSGTLRQGIAPPPGTLNFSHLLDSQSAPSVAIARAYRRALQRHRASVLDYAEREATGAPFGDPRLREALAAMLGRTRGLVAGGSDILVTRGSQMALYLAAQALIEPGDVVVVEALGYRPAWEAFRLAGARVVPVDVDADGLRVDQVPAAVGSGRLRAVYVTAHHQHATGVTLSESRRRALLCLADTHRVAIVEDDYDSDFHFEGQPALPLATRDSLGTVVYIGSLSKVLAPGLRIGFALAPAPMLERMAERRCFIDRQGDHVLGRGVAELLEDGEVQRHIRRNEADLRVQRDTLVDALRDAFGEALTFAVPSGGTALWVRTRDGLDVQRWQDCTRLRGADFCPGRQFTFADAAIPYARLGFASLPPEQIRIAVRRLHAGFMDAQ